jgi:hypothetical protein
MSGTIRQLEERQLPNEVTLMHWSPNMDLLAIANSKGFLLFIKAYSIIAIFTL